MGDQINVWIDDLQAFFLRILDLPMAFQLLIWILSFSTIWILFLYLLGVMKFKSFSTSGKITVYCSSIFITVSAVGASIFDYKQKQMESWILNNKKTVIITKVIESNSTESYFKNLIPKLKLLSFGKVSKVDYVENNPGLEILEISLGEPVINAFLATIDLKKYEVILDPDILQKELTSSYAKRFNVDFAVNGEAGTSPGKNAPLGQWTGNYVVNGKAILLQDSRQRPFFSFDKNSIAKYYSDTVLITRPNPEMHNVIWGRFDLMTNGKIAISPKDGTRNNLYPRTIVGVDKTGSRMFFLVADGRKPLYSKGMSMQMCGEIMKIVGAQDAMACDQGGSSMMYSKNLGVVNKPADGGERVVYTHLGFKIKK